MLGDSKKRVKAIDIYPETGVKSEFVNSLKTLKGAVRAGTHANYPAAHS